MYSYDKYDVIVIGGGHAGIEASVAAAKLGSRVALFTLSLDSIGNLPCNPSIGGTAKGHLVREIDAMGGCMGIAADATTIQTRMLNRGKGPAVHSLRVQTDRAQYHLIAKEMVEKTANLDIKQAEVTEILVSQGKVTGIRTNLGEQWSTKAVIIATGTNLGGKIYIGDTAYESGPDGMLAAGRLTQCLKKLGIQMLRFKTGTPARVHRRSIDFTKLPIQPGDDEIIPFSYTTKEIRENVVDCYITYTNEKTHQYIRENLHRAPLYAGVIEGIGPRYCPSIEDKVVRFADKDKHQLFIEPCGLHTEECYLQGMSTSLPYEVQIEMYRTIEGLENVEIMRPAYAIEYDCIDPLQLKQTLECISIEGLYGAGQFNGSSGYEEAAAQGLLAGINAARQIAGKQPIIMTRQQSYIGTLVDDLVTKGVSDPYRMMTSRSEYRLFLRQDNADERLTPLGREIGLVDDTRWQSFCQSKEKKDNVVKMLRKTHFSPSSVETLFHKKNIPPLKSGISGADLLKRPEISLEDVLELLPDHIEIDSYMCFKIETEIKYEGYIHRQMEQIEAVKKQENKLIPKGFQYENLHGLRLEAREKLTKIQPTSVGQAARIPGVSPSDISQLVLAIAIYEKKSEKSE